MSDLKQRLGWDDFFETQLLEEEKQSSTIARIVEPLRGLSRALCEAGEIWAEHSEKSASGAKSREAVPAIGDWVIGRLRDSGDAEKRMTIKRVLLRKNKLSRAATGGKSYEQILCTNVDTAFLTLAITQDLNLSAVGRYVEILGEMQIPLTILVTKVDEGATADKTLQVLAERAPGVPVHPISVKEGRGLEAIKPYFSNNQTVVLLGASGAGKSTLVNFLLGTESLRVENVRATDQKGRHTTTSRRLYSLPEGGMVIDSPGIREIQKWEEPIRVIEPKKKVKGNRSSRNRQEIESDDDYE